MRVAQIVMLFGVVLMLTAPAVAVEPAGETSGQCASVAEIAALRNAAGKAERQSSRALRHASAANSRSASAARKANAAKTAADQAAAAAKESKSYAEKVSRRQKTDREWLKVLYQGSNEDPSDPAKGTGLVAQHSRVIRDMRSSVSDQKTKISTLQTQLAHAFWWLWTLTGVLGVALLVVVANRLGLLDRPSDWADRAGGDEPAPGLDLDAAHPAPEAT